MQLTQKIINNLPKNYFRGMDLSYANFEGLRLYNFNFSGCNLTHSNLSSTHLSSANLSSANLSSANLCSANLCGADLEGANLWNCIINQYTYGISEELIKRFGIKITQKCN